MLLQNLFLVVGEVFGTGLLTGYRMVIGGLQKEGDTAKITMLHEWKVLPFT